MAQQTFSGVPAAFSAGEILTASDQEKLRDFLLYLIKDGTETSTGVTSPLILDLTNHDVNLDDSAKLQLGGGLDLQIYSNGSNSFIDHDGDGDLYIRARGTDEDLILDGKVYISLMVDSSTVALLSTSGLEVTGEVRANEGGDGGFVLRDWTGGSGNSSLATNGMAGNEYVVRSDGTHTFIGSGTGSDTYIRGAADASGQQLKIGSTRAEFADDLHVTGALSKGSGSFDIPHPTKGGDWRLRHSFIEGPTADLVYRGTVTLTAGTATIDLDEAAGMTAGTWEALCRNTWSIVSSSGHAVEWVLDGKTLTISGPDGAVCMWLVIGERNDDHIHQSSITDDDGRIVVEYERAPEPSPE
jgi:hypothetical protein